MPAPDRPVPNCPSLNVLICPDYKAFEREIMARALLVLLTLLFSKFPKFFRQGTGLERELSVLKVENFVNDN